MTWPIKILVGDVMERLRDMPADSVDCVVTSPPYWGLRDYGVEGQIGLEPTLGEHLSVMVSVLEEVRRVLKPSGTLWLNYGDCYATAPNGRSAADTKAAGNDDRTFRDKPFSTVGGNLKPKDLCMVPNRIAIALQEAGWWVRSEIIWAKPNPMPESIKDRPGTSHEKIFLLAKSGETTGWRARDTNEWSLNPDLSERLAAPTEDDPDATVNRWRACDYFYDAQVVRQGAVGSNEHDLQFRADREVVDYSGSRSLRNYEPAPVQVWKVAAQPFKDAHFATFPPELAERCLKAGCPAGGSVLDPFGGAGTTALVAWRMGLSATIIELNPDYAEIARARLVAEQGMWSNVEVIHGPSLFGEVA